MTRRGADDEPRLVVGLHPVREVLRAGQRLDRIQVASSRTSSDVLEEIRTLAAERGIPVSETDRDRLDTAAGGHVHQGVVATGPPYPYRSLDEVLSGIPEGEPPFLVALDGVTDPHNLGSVARTAESVGAHGLLIPARRAAGVNATSEKAAAGALAHLKVVRVTNLVRALRELGDRHVWSIGLDAGGAETIWTSRLLTEPLVLVVGSEGEGLARLSQVQCDQLVTVPMVGHIGSLNASVAAAVAMYEVRRRRQNG